MKKILLFLPLFLVSFLSSCNHQKQVQLLQGDHVVEQIGETVDFNKYISYPSGSRYKSTYVTPSKETKTARTMFYTLDEVGNYDFSFDFTLPDSNVENVKLTLSMLPVAPTVQEAKYTVKVNKNTTLKYKDIIEQSGLTATPSGYVDFKFKEVTYVDEYISVENYHYNKQLFSLDETKDEYTFVNYGSYKFLVNVFNISGNVNTYVNVDCFDSKAFGDDISVSGGIIGNDDDHTVKLLAPSKEGEVSHLGYKEQLSLNVGEYYTAEVKFKGQNAPQILFFGDTLDGSIYTNEGLIASTEGATPFDRFRIFGPERLKNSVPLADRERTIGRDTFRSDTVYLLKVLITRLDDSTCAIKALLYSKDKDNYKLVSTFDWASFNYENSLENRYIVYLGSTLGDIIFNFAKPYKSDKDGNKLGE